MYKYFLFFAIALVPCNALWAASHELFPEQTVVDVLNIDLNNDTWADRVIMHELDDGDVEVVFYIRELENYKLVYATRLKERLWAGITAGTVPSLAQNDAGSILINTQNITNGRNIWEQTITIAYRGNRLHVIEFTYNWYDRLNLKDHGQCDVDYLSRKVRLEKNDAPEKWLRLVGKILPVGNWTSDTIEDICFSN